MTLRIPARFQVIPLVLLLLLTAARWGVLWNSTLSLASAVWLWVNEPAGLRPAEAGRLFEFWLAACAWWASLVVLGFRVRAGLRRKSEPKFPPISRAFLLFMVFVSLTAPLLSPVPPDSQGDLASTRLLPPMARGTLLVADIPVTAALHEDLMRPLESRPRAAGGEGNFRFVFGTDDSGRDVLSRVIAGARVSLAVGVAAALMSVLIGSFVGCAAGLGGRALDFALMRLTDLALAVPGLFLAIGLMAMLGQSLGTLVVVLACTGWMGAARIVRGEVLSLREREYMLAARMLGVPALRLASRHLVPNLAPVIVSLAVLQFANAVLAEAALGFLGLGIQPPTATWGNMMGEAMGTLRGGWWVGLFPGALLAALLVAAHEIAEGGSLATAGAPERSGEP